MQICETKRENDEERITPGSIAHCNTILRNKLTSSSLSNFASRMLSTINPEDLPTICVICFVGCGGYCGGGIACFLFTEPVHLYSLLRLVFVELDLLSVLRFDSNSQLSKREGTPKRLSMLLLSLLKMEDRGDHHRHRHHHHQVATPGQVPLTQYLASPPHLPTIMVATLERNAKRYWHIHIHIVLAGHVDTNALERFGIPDSYDSYGPFHAVADVHWERMKTKLSDTASIIALKRWANANYNKGNPIDQIMLGDFDLATCTEFIQKVGERQQLQRQLAGIRPMPNRETPVPNNLPDAVIPVAISAHYNRYSDPNGTSEDAKIAREVLRCVNQWRRSSLTESTRRQAELILSILRKRSGLVIENGPYWDHFCRELRRIKSNSEEYTDNFARGAYAAVFKDLAGE